MATPDELLIFAARSGNDRLVRERIAAGADVNHLSARHGSALLEAIRCGHARVVHTLLEHGADPARAVWDGHGPLEFALRYGHDEITLALLQAQARLQPHSRDIFQTLLSECLISDRGSDSVRGARDRSPIGLGPSPDVWSAPAGGLTSA